MSRSPHAVADALWLKSAAAIEARPAGRAVPVTMELTSVKDIRAATARAADALGGLDLLINNAGVEQVKPRPSTWKRPLGS